MKKILFAKYNRTRREEYQISTCIYEDDTGCYVEKVALNQKALQHINDFEKKYMGLKEIYKTMKLLKPNVLKDRVIFNYIKGVTVDGFLMKYVTNINSLVEQIKTVISNTYVYNDDYVIDFYKTEDFVTVFGDIGNLSCRALKITNIDTIFDNIMIQGEELYCLDYEWVFDFPIPLDYSIYRSLLYFYNKYNAYISESMTCKTFIAEFGYNLEIQETYWNMEDNFQQYVQGRNRCYIYTNNYIKKTKTFEALQNFEQQLINKTEYANEITKLVQLKENHIENLERIIVTNNLNLDTKHQEIVQLESQFELKDNHIKNLENIIVDRDLNLDLNHQELDKLKAKDILKGNQIEYLENQLKLKDNHIENIEAKITKVIRNPIYGISLWMKIKLDNNKEKNNQ